MGLLTQWPQGAPTLLAKLRRSFRNRRTGLGRARNAPCKTLHGGVHRLPTDGHLRKKQHESVEVKLIFPGENRRRVDKKSVGRGATDSTKTCLGRTMQQGAGGCHLRLEQEDELDSRSPVNSY